MKIAIVGCGWVGVRLAAFLEEKNHQVIVTTTTTDKLEYLRLVAPEAYLFDFTNPQEVPELNAADLVIFSMPVAKDSWLEGFRKSKFNTKQTVFFSSTGVYPQQNGVFTEDHTENLREDIVKAEETVLAKFPQTTVLRLGGIMGDERSLQNFYRTKSPANPEKKANHIHFEDILQAIDVLITSPRGGETYNLVAPEHPTLGEILKTGPDTTSADSYDNGQRIISSQKLISDFNFKFKHPNPKYF